MQSINKGVTRTVILRLVPMLAVLYFMSYVDRVNVGFAALEMNADLGMSTAAYGLGAGLFFVGYFFFEVPSNLLLNKYGARMWLTRIVVTWGLIAAGTAFVQGPTSFYIMRLLLGVAEAGFFPGIVFFLGIWFARPQRARILSYVYLAAPLAFLLGSPLSAFLMSAGDGIAGLAGWRFMFLAEGLITVALGIVGWFVLVDRPSKAKWLDPADARALEDTIAAEDAQVSAAHGHGGLRKAFTPRVFALSFVFFGIGYGIYAVGFFLPLAIKGFQADFGVSLSLLQVGLITAIPYLFATIAMMLWSRRSDRKRERFFHVAVPAIVGGVALSFTFTLNSPLAIMAGVTVVAICMYCCVPVFWQIPPMFLTGAAAAAGIGVVNSIGNLSGFFAPYAMGYLKDTTGGYQAGMLLGGGFMIASALALIGIRARLRKQQQQAAEHQEAAEMASPA